jgi:DNA-binding beta-propeller fold protein YncE
MMCIQRLTLTGLATLCTVTAGLVFSNVPALALPVHAFTASFGGLGAGNAQFKEPGGVAVNDSTGQVYVVDKGNNRVEYFSSSGAYEGQFNGSDAPKGPFSEPTAVAVNQSDGDVWIVDSGHNVVDEFTEAGVYVTGSQLTGPSPGAPIDEEPFLDPDGVAVDPVSGDIYVADHRMEEHGPGIIDIFEPLGGTFKFKTQFTPELRPWSLAIDSNSNVYEAEAGAGQVHEYTAEGLLEVRKFEFATATEDPRAVAVDLSNNDVYIAANHPEPNAVEEAEGVVSEEGGSVDVYDPSGLQAESFVESFGAGSFGAAHVAHPIRGIAVNSSTHTVYVANQDSDSVDVFTALDMTVEPASPVTRTTAILHGGVNPGGIPVTACEFEFGLTTHYGKSAPCEPPAPLEGINPVAVGADLSDLQANATYHYRLVATNANGTFDGKDETLKTLPGPPTVNDRPPSATSVTRTTALLSGTINPENSPTKYHFEYGTTTAYGSSTIEASAGTGFGDETVGPVQVTGLQAGTTYDYRLVATNEAGGTETGPDYTFTTASRTPPVVETGEASGITQTGATISDTVDPRGLQTSYEFELGTVVEGQLVYNGAKIFGSAGAGTGAETITLNLENLAPSVTYHYRLAATNADGTEYGADQAFTTGSFPAAFTPPAAATFIPYTSIGELDAREAQEGKKTTPTKPLTKAQRLARALKACRKKSKGKRAACRKRARTQYAPAKAEARQKHNKQH